MLRSVEACQAGLLGSASKAGALPGFAIGEHGERWVHDGVAGAGAPRAGGGASTARSRSARFPSCPRQEITSRRCTPSVLQPHPHAERVPQVYLAPLAGPRRASLALRGRSLPAMRSIVRCDRVRGASASSALTVYAEAAPHPNPLPVKNGERERTALCRNSTAKWGDS